MAAHLLLALGAAASLAGPVPLTQGPVRIPPVMEYRGPIRVNPAVFTNQYRCWMQNGHPHLQNLGPKTVPVGAQIYYIAHIVWPNGQHYYKYGFQYVSQPLAPGEVKVAESDLTGYLDCDGEVYAMVGKQRW